MYCTPAFEDGTDTGFRNVGQLQFDAGEIPRRKYTMLRYCLNDFEMVPVTPIITAINFVLNSTSAEFLLQGLYILVSSHLLP